MIRLNCPTCGQKLGVDDARAGRMATCPKCRSKFRVPGENKSKPGDRELQAQHKARRQAEDADKTWVGDEPPPEPAKTTRPPAPPSKKPAPAIDDVEIGDFEIIESNPDFEIVDEEEEPKKPIKAREQKEAIRAHVLGKNPRLEDLEGLAESDDDEERPRKRRRDYEDTDEDDEPRRKRKKKRKKRADVGTSAAMPILIIVGSVVFLWLGLTALAVWVPLGTFALLGIGGVTAVVGRIWFLFVVGQDDPMQRILVRFVPLYDWFYFFTHLEESLKPFMCSCIGTVFLITGGLFFFLHPRHADHTDWEPSPGAHARNPAKADAECAKLLALQNKAEARQWLQGTPNRSFFKWGRQRSIQAVEELYKLGAKEVWAVNLENGGFLANLAGELIIVLPQEPEPRKKLLVWHNANFAEDPEDKLTDKGQKYMYLSLD